MSYISTGLTEQQEQTLTQTITPQELTAMPVREKIDIALEYQRIQAEKSASFWSAFSGFVMVALPLATFLGIMGFKK